MLLNGLMDQKRKRRLAFVIAQNGYSEAMDYRHRGTKFHDAVAVAISFVAL